MKHIAFFIVLSFLFLQAATAAEPEPAAQNVLTKEFGYDADPKLMMKTFLLDETAAAKRRWKESYEKLKTVDEFEAYKSERKEYMLRMLGETWPRETPLNARVTKTLKLGTPGKDAYSVEMVVFESVPGFYVSGAVYLPDPEKFKPPYPVVLVVCGHSHTGKARDLYQKAPALAAVNGLLAMSIDPIDQGERSQRLTEAGKPKAQSVAAHNVIGASSIPLGRNAATFEYRDMVRALDYLQSRPDVVKDKIGVTGTSGGGTQTSYIMALDDRVAAAAPSCYLCDLFDLVGGLGPQDAEQNIFGQLGFGMDHADYCIMRAPLPTLIETTTADFFPVEGAWTAYRHAKRVYDRYGYSERMSLIEHDDKHGWQKNLREAAVRWMLRWLAGRDEAIVEADDLPITAEKEFIATPRGEVMLLDGARSAFDLNRDYNEELLARRKAKNEARSADELAAAIRKTAGIRPTAEIPKPTVESKGKLPAEPAVYKNAKEVERFVLATESGRIHLPGLCFRPQGESKGVTILLRDAGKPGPDDARLGERLAAGRTVWAVDLRGLGETQGIGNKYYRHEMFGTDGTDYYIGYLLGKSYVGMRTEDLLALTRYLAEVYPGQKPELVADGESVGLVALHAAALEPASYAGLTLPQTPRSWYEVVKAGDSPYPITNHVHGALLEYDVPELSRLSRPYKVQKPEWSAAR